MPKVKSIQSTIWERYTRVTGRLTDAYRLRPDRFDTWHNGQRQRSAKTCSGHGVYSRHTRDIHVITCARLCDQVGLSVILSVRSLIQKNYASCMDLLEILPKGNPFSRWFHFGDDPGWTSLSFMGYSRPAKLFWRQIDCSRDTSKVTIEH